MCRHRESRSANMTIREAGAIVAAVTTDRRHRWRTELETSSLAPGACWHARRGALESRGLKAKGDLLTAWCQTSDASDGFRLPNDMRRGSQMKHVLKLLQKCKAWQNVKIHAQANASSVCSLQIDFKARLDFKDVQDSGI